MAAALPLVPERSKCDPAGSGPWAKLRPCPACPACRYWIHESNACAIDVAEARGPMLREEIGELLEVSRERVRQIEEKALAKLGRVLAGRGLSFAALVPDDRDAGADLAGDEGDEP